MTISQLLEQFGDKYVLALLTTWKLTACAFVIAFAVGVLITVMRICPIRPLQLAGDFYVQLFRNIPGAALLILLVYALPYLRLVWSYYACVLIATSLIPAAFCSEYLMAGMNTIAAGQIEAARSLGMRESSVFFKIVFPQALRYVVPAMISELVIVLKNTTFAYVVNYADLMQNARVLISNYDALLSVYLVTAVIYILINYALNRISVAVARRQDAGARRAAGRSR